MYKIAIIKLYNTHWCTCKKKPNSYSNFLCTVHNDVLYTPLFLWLKRIVAVVCLLSEFLHKNLTADFVKSIFDKNKNSEIYTNNYNI